VVGMTDEYTYFKYNQATDPDDIGRFMVYRGNPEAYWFDDYTDLVDEGRIWKSGRADGDPGGREAQVETEESPVVL
jgi:lysine 2,3-aminomutase